MNLRRSWNSPAQKCCRRKGRTLTDRGTLSPRTQPLTPHVSDGNVKSGRQPSEPGCLEKPARKFSSSDVIAPQASRRASQKQAELLLQGCASGSVSGFSRSWEAGLRANHVAVRVSWDACRMLVCHQPNTTMHSGFVAVSSNYCFECFLL